MARLAAVSSRTLNVNRPVAFPAGLALAPAEPGTPGAAERAPARAEAGILDDPLELARFTRFSETADGRRSAESTLRIAGITCAACSGILEAALGRVDGVLEARVSAAAERAQVRWDPARTRPSALLAAIRGAGYDAVPDAAAPARELRRAEQRRMLWRLFVAWFCMMQVMMMATPSYVAAPGELADDLRRLLAWGGWVLTLPVMVFSAGSVFGGAWRALRQRRIGMDVPVALALAVAFVASTGAVFDPGGVFGHEVYFDSVTMFVAFLLGARWLEMRARHRAHETLESALAAMPPTALRETAAGGVERVSVQRLAPGDTVRVPLGESFPADGVLLEGATRADEALLSGESTPVDKPAGAPLVAGSGNLGAAVRMRVERVGADTRYERIVAMMRDAMTQRPASARLADRWAAPFLWAVLLLAAGSAAAWSLIDPARALAVAVAVLIVTCPCALSLAAPATLVAVAGGLARRGVLVQRLDAIEQFARVQQLFVDKTGTLTEDRLQLAAVRLAPDPSADGAAGPAPDEAPDSRSGGSADAAIDARQALCAAAALARWSTHPVARAIADADADEERAQAAAGAARTPATAAARAAADAGTMHEVRETAGVGIEGMDARGRRWQLGDPARLAAAAGAVWDLRWAGAARSLLVCDGRPLAAFELDEVLRPAAAEALRALGDEGVGLTLLSGDDPARVQALATRLGLHDAVGAARPEDKLEAVAAAQREGRFTAMVGDGVNDAPVLARADVSLAMGQGALVARAQADAVVVGGRWEAIVDLRRSARRAVRIVRQNFAWAALYNACGIPLAMAGWLPPWAAGLGMAASSLLVVGNALRAGASPPARASAS
ncbi:MAG: cation-translocating P-type ATPase [Burkholderiaceae bacterium]|nr:cation-translocating P-type ATPase [Burkholderiaceae bacterium]